MTRNIYWNSEMLGQNVFFNCRFPRSNILEQLKFELEKELGFRNLLEKLEKV